MDPAAVSVAGTVAVAEGAPVWTIRDITETMHLAH
jgi:hypothetical protein